MVIDKKLTTTSIKHDAFKGDINSEMVDITHNINKVDSKSTHQDYTHKNYQLSSQDNYSSNKLIAKLTNCLGCKSRIHIAWNICPSCSVPTKANLYEAFIERAAIMEYDGGYSRAEAEEKARKEINHIKVL